MSPSLPADEPDRRELFRLLITAGPTQEPIDAVRFIGNRSSGRLGLAVAAEAVERGLPTTLLLGPTSVDPPRGSILDVRRFRTTDDLARLLERHWPDHDVLIMAAAVADYRPRRVPGGVSGEDPESKLTRGDAGITLDLEPTEDLLASLATTRRDGQTLIGFALEPATRLEESARRKLAAKGIDAIVANPLDTMESDEIDATLFLAGGETVHAGGLQPKPRFAAWLLDQVPSIRTLRGSPT